MTRTCSLHEACDELFAEYPLAVSVDNRDWAVHSMVLMLRDHDVRFFVLSQDGGASRPRYALRQWPAGGIVTIEADSGTAVSGTVASAVMNGVPIPQDGSLFGWRCGDAVTALVAVYARYTRSEPEPFWSVLPLAGIPETQWPPFTRESLFGHWFWEHYQAGSIVSLDGLIARTPATVFWIETTAIFGSGCCAVARDIRSPEGFTLPCGRYVFDQALRAGKPVPSLEMLLNGYRKTDLASRF
jgi:hypothetical protein